MTCSCSPNSEGILARISGHSRPRSQPAPAVRVGRIQRESPLPIGQYWIDVIGPKAQADFAAWRFENQTSLLILTTESFPSEGGFPAREWVKFEVLTPTPWNLGTSVGFPEIIEEGQDIDSSEDTASKPDPTDCALFPDSLDCQLKSKATSGYIIAAAVAAGALVVLALRR